MVLALGGAGFYFGMSFFHSYDNDNMFTSTNSDNNAPQAVLPLALHPNPTSAWPHPVCPGRLVRPRASTSTTLVVTEALLPRTPLAPST